MAGLSRQARMVYRAVGPVEQLQLRELDTDWVVWSTGTGMDPHRDVARMRYEAHRLGYVVVGEVAIEN